MNHNWTATVLDVELGFIQIEVLDIEVAFKTILILADRAPLDGDSVVL